MVILLNEGMLKFKDDVPSSDPRIQFLKFCSPFPMEIQMILCLRASRLATLFIRTDDFKTATIHLLRSLKNN